MSAKNPHNILKQLEEDYIQSIRKNDSSTVETFIETFLSSSWDYNQQNMDKIKAVFTGYEEGIISKQTFSSLFNEMVRTLHTHLKELDKNGDYPLLHTKDGAAIIVSVVDGLIVQYYVSVYDMEYLKNMTPHLTRVILQALKTESIVQNNELNEN